MFLKDLIERPLVDIPIYVCCDLVNGGWVVQVPEPGRWEDCAMSRGLYPLYIIEVNAALYKPDTKAKIKLIWDDSEAEDHHVPDEYSLAIGSMDESTYLPVAEKDFAEVAEPGGCFSKLKNADTPSLSRALERNMVIFKWLHRLGATKITDLLYRRSLFEAGAVEAGGPQLAVYTCITKQNGKFFAKKQPSTGNNGVFKTFGEMSYEERFYFLEEHRQMCCSNPPLTLDDSFNAVRLY